MLQAACANATAEHVAVSYHLQQQLTERNRLEGELAELETRHSSSLGSWGRSRDGAAYVEAARERKAFHVRSLQIKIQNVHAQLEGHNATIRRHMAAKQRRKQRAVAAKRQAAGRQLRQLGGQLKRWYAAPGDIGTPAFEPQLLDVISLENLDVSPPWDVGTALTNAAQLRAAELRSIRQRLARCGEEMQMIGREAVNVLDFHAHYVTSIQV